MSDHRAARHQPAGHGSHQPGRVPRRSPRKASSFRHRHETDERHERYTLIEFTWDVAGGVQPVILPSRRFRH